MNENPTATDPPQAGRFRALIAGGGVAAIEALLALRALAGSRIDIGLLAPEPEFSYRPLAVAEPFGRGGRTRFDLAKIVSDQGADHFVDALASVDSTRHEVRTSSGTRIEYGALLIAVGGRPVEVVPGALTYRGAADNERLARVLGELTEGHARRVAFAVPGNVRWPLALYELALMTAAHLSSRGVEGAELILVTPEDEPLTLFGSRISARVRGMLDGAGVKFRGASTPAFAEDGHLTLAGGDGLAVDHVVALPAFEVPPIPGIPQDPEGFIHTSVHMKVEGLADVYAAGDVTSFPIKQGGLATQQADVAAASIAARAGAPAPRDPFRPMLRAALLTGSVPHYLRTGPNGRTAGSTEAERPLWWPPAKIAGRHLAPYLALGGGVEPREPLADLEPVLGDDAEAEADHIDAVELALTVAEADARWGDYEAALRWLNVAEQLDLVLPPEYEQKRRAWSAAKSS